MVVTLQSKTAKKYLFEFLNGMIAIEEITGGETLFAGELEGIQLKELTMEAGDKERLAIDEDLAGGKIRVAIRLRRLVDFQNCFLAISSDQGRPGAGYGRKTTDEVVDLLGRLMPVDLASGLEKLGGKL